jgi:hypothetical protein
VQNEEILDFYYIIIILCHSQFFFIFYSKYCKLLYNLITDDAWAVKPSCQNFN